MARATRSPRLSLPGLPAGDARDNVFAFAEDTHGDVWGVGRFGLQLLTGASPRRFRKTDGLRDDFVASIAPARRWIASRRVP